MSLAALRSRLPPWARWALPVSAVTVAAQALMVWRVREATPAGARPGLLDSIIFEYIGWYLTTGADMYADAWEIKPPLNFEITAVIALLTPNVTVYHWTNVALSCLLAVGSALAVAAIVAELTDDAGAAVVAGVALYALPAFWWRAAFGYKAKYVVVFAGLLAAYLALRDRHFGAGVAAGVTVAIWQMAIVFPAIALGLALQRSRAAAKRTVAGVLLVGVVTVAPVVLLWDAVPAMIIQVVFTPILVTEGGDLVSRFQWAWRLFGNVIPVVAVGAYGVYRTHREEYRSRQWWVLVGAGWFAVQSLVLDLDFYPDLFPLMAFLAIGVGLLHGTSRLRRFILPGLVGVIAFVGIATFGDYGTARFLYMPDAHYVQTGAALQPPYSGAARRHLYWNRVESETCRIFFGPTQRALIDIIGGSETQQTCGTAFWSAARAVAAKFVPI